MSWQIRQAATAEEVAAVLTALLGNRSEETTVTEAPRNWARSLHPATGWAPAVGWATRGRPQPGQEGQR